MPTLHAGLAGQEQRKTAGLVVEHGVHSDSIRGARQGVESDRVGELRGAQDGWQAVVGHQRQAAHTRAGVNREGVLAKEGVLNAKRGGTRQRCRPREPNRCSAHIAGVIRLTDLLRRPQVRVCDHASAAQQHGGSGKRIIRQDSPGEHELYLRREEKPRVEAVHRNAISRPSNDREARGIGEAPRHSVVRNLRQVRNNDAGVNRHEVRDIAATTTTTTAAQC